jgi:hypothetical protein
LVGGVPFRASERKVILLGFLNFYECEHDDEEAAVHGSTVEQPIQESLLRPELHAVRTT